MGDIPGRLEDEEENCVGHSIGHRQMADETTVEIRMRISVRDDC